jgi:hypothetical protein
MYMNLHAGGGGGGVLCVYWRGVAR